MERQNRIESVESDHSPSNMNEIQQNDTPYRFRVI